MDVTINNGSWGPFMKFTLAIEMFESCLERFYERTKREDGAEIVMVPTSQAMYTYHHPTYSTDTVGSKHCFPIKHREKLILGGSILYSVSAGKW